MQRKNKIIIGLSSLLVVVAIIFTIKSRVVVKNKEVMEGLNISNKSEIDENSTEKDTNTLEEKENSSNDTTSGASKDEETIKDTVKEETTSDSKKDVISKTWSNGENKSEISNNEGHEESSSNKVQEERGSSDSKKENNFIKESETVIKNKNEKVMSYRSENKNKLESKESNFNKKELNKIKNNTENIVKVGNNKNKDAVSSASKEKHKENNTKELTSNTDKKSGTFIERTISEKNTKLIDLGWVKYIVVTFNQGNINDYDLYVLDNGNYKTIKPSMVDDSGKVVKWEIDKLGYNTIKVKNKKSEEEGTYKFAK